MSEATPSMAARTMAAALMPMRMYPRCLVRRMLSPHPISTAERCRKALRQLPDLRDKKTLRLVRDSLAVRGFDEAVVVLGQICEGQVLFHRPAVGVELDIQL